MTDEADMSVEAGCVAEGPRSVRDAGELLCALSGRAKGGAWIEGDRLRCGAC